MNDLQQYLNRRATGRYRWHTRWTKLRTAVRRLMGTAVR